MKKARFNVGDKVRILDGSKIKNYAASWYDEGMSFYVGKTCEIVEVITSCSAWEFAGYRLKDAGGYTYDERGLKPINESIIIYRKGNEVIATDKTTGESASAKCSPDDTFDFMTGAKIAFERLRGARCKFKVGDRVIRNDDHRYGITRTGWKGYVVAILDNDTINVCKDKNGRAAVFTVKTEYFDLIKDEIEVGDKVKIINTGKTFTTCFSWVVDNIQNKAHVARYAYSDDLGYNEGIRERDEVYRVLHVDDDRAYITENSRDVGGCYLIGLDGLKKC